MRKAAAFSLAFLVTLAVAFVPLAVTDRQTTEAQPAGGSEPPELTVPEYRYDVLSGVQSELDAVLYLRSGKDVTAGEPSHESNNRDMPPTDHQHAFAQRKDMFIQIDPHVDEGRLRDRSVTLLLALDGILDNRDF